MDLFRGFPSDTLYKWVTSIYYTGIRASATAYEMMNLIQLMNDESGVEISNS